MVITWDPSKGLHAKTLRERLSQLPSASQASWPIFWAGRRQRGEPPKPPNVPPTVVVWSLFQGTWVVRLGLWGTSQASSSSLRLLSFLFERVLKPNHRGIRSQILYYYGFWDLISWYLATSRPLGMQSPASAVFVVWQFFQTRHASINHAGPYCTI